MIKFLVFSSICSLILFKKAYSFCQYWGFKNNTSIQACEVECQEETCAKCQEQSSCQECTFGFSYNSTSNSCKIECVNNFCTTCKFNNITICTSCQFGYKLENITCQLNEQSKCRMYLQGFCDNAQDECSSSKECLSCDDVDKQKCTNCYGFYPPINGYCISPNPSTQGLSKTGIKDLANQLDSFNKANGYPYLNEYDVLQNDPNIITLSNPIYEETIINFCYEAVGTPIDESYRYIYLVSQFYDNLIIPEGSKKQFQSNRLERLAIVISILSNAGGTKNFRNRLKKNGIIFKPLIENLNNLITMATKLSMEYNNGFVNVKNEITLLRLLGSCDVLLRVIDNEPIKEKSQGNLFQDKTEYFQIAADLNNNLEILLNIFFQMRIKDNASNTKLDIPAQNQLGKIQEYWFNEQSAQQSSFRIKIQAIGELFKQDYVIEIDQIKITIKNDQLLKLLSLNQIPSSYAIIGVSTWKYNVMQQVTINPYKLKELSNVVQVFLYKGEELSNMVLVEECEGLIQYKFPLKNSDFSNFVWQAAYWDKSLSRYSSYRSVQNELFQFELEQDNEYQSNLTTQKTIYASWQIKSFAKQGVIGGYCLEGFANSQDNNPSNSETSCIYKCNSQCLSCTIAMQDNCDLCLNGWETNEDQKQINQKKICECQNNISSVAISKNGKCEATQTDPISIIRTTNIIDLEKFAYLSILSDQEMKSILEQLIQIADKSRQEQNDPLKMPSQEFYYQTYSNIAVIISQSKYLGTQISNNIQSLLSAVLDYNIIESPYCTIKRCAKQLFYALDNILYFLINCDEKYQRQFESIEISNQARLKAINGFEELVKKIAIKITDVNENMPGSFVFNLKSSHSYSKIIYIDENMQNNISISLNNNSIFLSKKTIEKLKGNYNDDNQQIQLLLWITQFNSQIFNIPSIIIEQMSQNSSIHYIKLFNIFRDNLTLTNRIRLPIKSIIYNENQTEMEHIRLNIYGQGNGTCLYYQPKINQDQYGNFQKELTAINTIQMNSIDLENSTDYRSIICNLLDWSYGFYGNFQHFSCPSGYYSTSSTINGCYKCPYKVLECVSQKSFITCNAYINPFYDGSIEQSASKCKCIADHQLTLQDNSTYICRHKQYLKKEFLQINFNQMSLSQYNLLWLEKAALLATDQNQLSKVCEIFKQFSKQISADVDLINQATKIISAIIINENFTILSQFNAIQKFIEQFSQSDIQTNNSIQILRLLDALGVIIYQMSINSQQKYDIEIQFITPLDYENYLNNLLKSFFWLVNQLIKLESPKLLSTIVPINFNFQHFKIQIFNSYNETQDFLNQTSRQFFLLFQNNQSNFQEQQILTINQRLFGLQEINNDTFSYYISRIIFDMDPYTQFNSSKNQNSVQKIWTLCIYNKFFQDISFKFRNLTYNSISIQEPVHFMPEDIAIIQYFDVKTREYKELTQNLTLMINDNKSYFQFSLPFLNPESIYRTIIQEKKTSNMSKNQQKQYSTTCYKGQYSEKDLCKTCPNSCEICDSADKCKGNCGLFGFPNSNQSCLCSPNEIKLYNGKCLDKLLVNNLWNENQNAISKESSFEKLLLYASYASQYNSDAIKQILNRINNIYISFPISNQQQALEGAQIISILIEQGNLKYMVGNWDSFTALVKTIIDSEYLNQSYYKSFLSAISKSITIIGEQDPQKQEELTKSLYNAFSKFANVAMPENEIMPLSDGSILIYKQYSSSPEFESFLNIGFSDQYKTYQIKFNKDLYEACKETLNSSIILQSYYLRKDNFHKISKEIQSIESYIVSIQTYNISNQYSIVNKISLPKDKKFYISMDVIGSKQECSYWNGNKWEIDGLEKYGNDCKCTHLTDFAIVKGVSNAKTTQNEKEKKESQIETLLIYLIIYFILS